MEDQLVDTIVIGDGETVIINQPTIAPIGEPAVDISSDNAQVDVEANGTLEAPDPGNTAVVSSGANAADSPRKGTPTLRVI